MANAIRHMSVAEYRALMAAKKPISKHRNEKVYVYQDGYISDSKQDTEKHGKILDRFDSKKEYARWKELQLMERMGLISELKKQVPFLVQSEFVDANGKKHRATFYNADFTYKENGEFIVEDVKGLDKKTGKFLTTQVFNLKWKLLQAQNPNYTFKLF